MPFDANIIEARLALELIVSIEMPSIAADALEAGLDGKAIRRLSALDKPTWFEVREVLPAAMKEMRLSTISPEEGAVRIARQIAEEVLSSGRDPVAGARELFQLWVRAGYAKKLQNLGTLDDATYFMTPERVRAHIVSELKAFVAAN